MSVLTYSSLLSSGSFLATSARGAANGVAPLDSSTKVPVSYIGTNTPTSSTFLRGDNTWQVVAGGGSSTPTTFAFRVNFVSSVATTVAEMPTGWTATVVSGVVTVTHNVAAMPKFVSYMGCSTTLVNGSSIFRYRGPTIATEMLIDNAFKTSKFSMALSSSAVGAEPDGYGYVNIAF